MRQLLILDDNPQAVALFERFAVRAGFQAHGFTEPRAFFSELKDMASSPDVLLDLHMPDIGGIDIVEELQSLRFDGRVFLTSGADAPVLEAAGKLLGNSGARIAGLLPKPFSYADFERLLKADAFTKDGDPISEPSEALTCSREEFAQIEATLEPYFQPKVWSQSRDLAGFEVLARFRNAAGDILPTEHCIARLQSLGRINEFTATVIELGFAWASMELPGNQIISINIEPEFFQQAGMIEKIEQLRQAHGLEASQVVFEVTERSGLPEDEAVLKSFTKLRVAGYGIAIDDFGIGFSSLKQLSDYPFSEIKIDGSFVARMEHEARAAEIVRAVVKLAKRTDIVCTAERVETETVAQILQEAGCDQLQGYWTGRPMPADEATALIASSLQNGDTQVEEKSCSEPELPSEEPQSKPRVAIVDDESGVRQTLVRGLERHGFTCRPFRSGADFLESLEFELPDCVILDMRMPEMDGLSVLDRIPPAAQAIPVVMLTSHGEISLAVDAMNAGAVDFVEKPVSIKRFARKIGEHIAHSVELRRTIDEVEHIKAQIASLTSRERDIAAQIADGHSNKEIARILDISPRTVETHRASIFKKLGVRNAVEFALLFEKASLAQ
ncbi:EAL domain-containing protein [Erythrobacter sp.]|uniref:EAL domain-containing protein n=1 Tax=Erythrobacter sp. TaxID=1042 RepID=UPI00345BED07